MPYNTFTLEKVVNDFELIVAEDLGLFRSVPTLAPSKVLEDQLKRQIPLAEAIGTEKAKSELIVAPVLLEIVRKYDYCLSFFSGVTFNVLPEKGLNGVCDFILSRSLQQLFIEVPVVMLVEAKDDSISDGLGQCVAEMLAAKVFNERKGQGDLAIYGAVTNGSTWRFLRLEGQKVEIGPIEFLANQIDHILGIFAAII